MATSLSTQFISTPTCYNRPHVASPLCFSASPALRSLTFDPFRSRKRMNFPGNAFLVRSSMESVEAASEVMASSFPHLVARAEGFLYTLADAAVSAAPPAAADSVQTTQTSNSDWFSGITNILESFLKTLQDGLQTVHVPYSYGFAIILLTVIVKALTLPLTQKQVESSLAMQNLSPKVKAIQERYAGNQAHCASVSWLMFTKKGPKCQDAGLTKFLERRLEDPFNKTTLIHCFEDVLK